MAEMRRKDRQRDIDFALDVVDNCDYAVLAMIDTDGNPYCVPISIVRADNGIYFHCAQEGRKTECLKNNPKVCITCVTDTFKPDYYFTTAFKSAIIEANAVELTDEAEKRQALKLLCLRHNPGNMAGFDAEMAEAFNVTAVWRFDITDIKGKERVMPIKGE